MYVFRNRTYAKPQIVQNVTRILVPYANTSRRSTGLNFTPTNGIKAMARTDTEEEEEVTVAVEATVAVVVLTTVRVPTMRHRTEAMKCR